MRSARTGQAYADLFGHFLLCSDPLQREEALLAASEIAKAMLAEQLPIDEMIGLHQRTQAHLAALWRQALPGSAEAHAHHRLAAGEAIPLMLAAMLPYQLDEQIQAQRAWLEEHGKLAAMFEQTDDLVLVFDAAGRLEYLNPAFERATDWHLAQAQARQAEVWLTPLTALQTRHMTADQPCADGSFFLATWSVSPISDRDGRLLSHVCIGRDITQLQRLEAGVRQNDKLRAVATLAAGVAHDFNNLLGSIIGLAELSELQVDPGTPSAPKLARNLAGILQASHRAADLVGQLLSFSSENPARPQAVAVGALLQRCEPLLAASLPIGVSLLIESAADDADDTGADDASVLADTAQIEQVLLNLVKNAGYAMRAKGGVVRLLADRAWLDKPGDGLPDAIRLRVIDCGEGIAPDVLPRIFEPFFTTKPVGAGTGLGLAAAHGIVRDHGGRLDARSTPGVETVFSLRLPLIGAAAPA